MREVDAPCHLAYSVAGRDRLLSLSPERGDGDTPARGSEPTVGAAHDLDFPARERAGLAVRHLEQAQIDGDPARPAAEEPERPGRRDGQRAPGRVLGAELGAVLEPELGRGAGVERG